MLRLALYVVVGLAVIGAIMAGAVPHTLAGVTHDIATGYHWAAHQIAHLEKKHRTAA